MEIKVLNTLNSEHDGKLTTPNVSTPMNKHTTPYTFRRAIEVAACELWIPDTIPDKTPAPAPRCGGQTESLEPTAVPGACCMRPARALRRALLAATRPSAGPVPLLRPRVRKPGSGLALFLFPRHSECRMQQMGAFLPTACLCQILHSQFVPGSLQLEPCLVAQGNGGTNARLQRGRGPGLLKALHFKHFTVLRAEILSEGFFLSFIRRKGT